MESIEHKKTKRWLFMQKLYEATEGNRLSFANCYEIGQSLGFQNEETDAIVTYLSGEGLLKRRTREGGITIEHAGTVEVEAAISEPRQSTQHFPATINVLNIGHMENSHIQQGTHNSQQTVTFNIAKDFEGLRALAAKIKVDLPQVESLTSEARQEATFYADGIERNLALSKPNEGFIRTSLQSVRTILEGATGNVVAKGLLAGIQTFFQ